jgi:hypothetical protein
MGDEPVVVYARGRGPGDRPAAANTAVAVLATAGGRLPDHEQPPLQLRHDQRIEAFGCSWDAAPSVTPMEARGQQRFHDRACAAFFSSGTPKRTASSWAISQGARGSRAARHRSRRTRGAHARRRAQHRTHRNAGPVG